MTRFVTSLGVTVSSVVGSVADVAKMAEVSLMACRELC